MKEESKSESSRLPWILIGLTGGVAVGITAVSAPFVTPALRRFCLPYLPATTDQLFNVQKALNLCPKSKPLLDVGSGDGRIVFEAAKRGFQAHGVELNVWLVLYSRFAALAKGRQIFDRTSFSRNDLWKMNMRGYGTTVIFGVEEMMAPLGEKFSTELNDDAHVVACRFPIPGWSPFVTIGEGIDTVWVYKVSSQRR
ncbi:unnamed protein product [Notodromas monacha]|uniref:Uncharacterized protein n=1 Tax=Notodromas monacha TaxID=399045 RepID=A0A7R9BVJ0_9CRUS|nr:unnamed protein product [Notodromas monacha]CAG0921560.1 unnamed protein product [Notodromas monacha]